MRSLPKRSYSNRFTYKSRNGWKNDSNSRVRPEEIANPKCFIEDKDNAYPYPGYHVNQTEEIMTFKIKPYSVGFDVKEYEEYPCNINACLLHNEIGQSCKRNSPLLQ